MHFPVRAERAPQLNDLPAIRERISCVLSVAGSGSLIRNHATKSAGRDNSVSMVPTMMPPRARWRGLCRCAAAIFLTPPSRSIIPRSSRIPVKRFTLVRPNAPLLIDQPLLATCQTITNAAGALHNQQKRTSGPR